MLKVKESSYQYFELPRRVYRNCDPSIGRHYSFALLKGESV